MSDDTKKLSKEEIIKRVSSGDFLISYQEINDQFKNDKDIIKAFIKKDGTQSFLEDPDDDFALGYLKPDLKEDRELLLLAFEADSKQGLISPEKKYVPEKFHKDEEVILAAVKGGWEFKNVDSSFKDNKDIIKAAISKNSKLYETLDANLKKDKDILIEAIKGDPKNSFSPSSQFEFADESLKKDREVVLSASKINGFILKFVDESFKKDKEIVLEAVKQSPLVFEEIDDTLKEDKDIIIEAVKRNSYIFQKIKDEFKKDEEICLASLTKDTGSFFYMDENLKKDKKFIIKAIHVNPKVLQQVDENIQNDPEIFELVKAGKAFKDLYTKDLFTVLKNVMPNFEFLCFAWSGGGDDFGGYKLKHSKQLNKEIDEVKIDDETIKKVESIMDYCMIIQELELKVNWVDAFSCKGGLVVALNALTKDFNWKISNNAAWAKDEKFNDLGETDVVIGEINLPTDYIGFSISGEGSEEIFSENDEVDDADEFKEPEYDVYKFTRGVEIKN